MTSHRIVRLLKSREPIAKPVLKFGGDPVWLQKPQWPTSPGWDKPMQFIAQIPLELIGLPKGRMAYLFITHADSADSDFLDPDTLDPEAGETALIIQPNEVIDIPHRDSANGPTLYDENDKRVEFSVELKKSDEVEGNEFDEDQAFGDKIGGFPEFFQGGHTPDGHQLLLQLNGSFQPFHLNLGSAPLIFAFVKSGSPQGKVLIEDS